MTGIPTRPKIYHITHLRNLPQIAKSGRIWSDAKCSDLGLNCQIVGMSRIKKRRLQDLEVKCHPGTKVGQYVPFYFCPRSIMLYILHCGNHPDVNYRGGQRSILHLQADLSATVRWADENRRKWAFSNINAGAFYADFFKNLDQLFEVDWNAVAATDFRAAAVKEGKQASGVPPLWVVSLAPGGTDRRS
jgi:hypothetical protein